MRDRALARMEDGQAEDQGASTSTSGVGPSACGWKRNVRVALRSTLVVAAFLFANLYIASSSHIVIPFAFSRVYYVGETRYTLPAHLERGKGMQAPFLVKPHILHDVTKLIEAFDAAATSTGMRYAADESTLLGAMRHGGQMPWDDDSDVTVLIDDLHLLLGPVRAELNKAGYDLYMYPFGYKVTQGFWDAAGRSIRPPKPSLPFMDVFLGEVQPNGDFLRVYLNSPVRTKLPFDNFPNPALPAPWWLPFRRVPYSGTAHGVMAPAKPEEVLDSIYGATWPTSALGRGPILIVKNHWGSAVADFVHGHRIVPIPPAVPGEPITEATVARMDIHPKGTRTEAAVNWVRVLGHAFTHTQWLGFLLAVAISSVFAFVVYHLPLCCLEDDQRVARAAPMSWSIHKRRL